MNCPPPLTHVAEGERGESSTPSAQVWPQLTLRKPIWPAPVTLGPEHMREPVTILVAGRRTQERLRQSAQPERERTSP